jgi:serine/threonine protein kinase
MGVVWHARDEMPHRDVANKEVHRRVGLTDQEADLILRRTLREARAAAQLRHPGIVVVYDVVTDDGRPWIVMELVDGCRACGSPWDAGRRRSAW